MCLLNYPMYIICKEKHNQSVCNMHADHISPKTVIVISASQGGHQALQNATCQIAFLLRWKKPQCFEPKLSFQRNPCSAVRERQGS